MHVLQAFENLVDDILFVDIFQDIRADDCVKVCIHEVKHQVYVPIVLGPNHVLQTDYILVAGQLLQEYDLSKCALSVCCILKSIKVLFKSNYLLRLLVNCFPHNTVCTLPYTIN